MSGHSKWSQIKHKKAATDAKRGVLFGKLARAITIAARGNPDPETNNRLHDEIGRARAANMPNESIARAIKRVTDKDAAALEDLQLEFIGPGNTALLVTAITDNGNRTIGELRALAAPLGGSPASPGAVTWMFTRTGVITVTVPPARSDEAQLAAIDAGASEVNYADGELTVLASPSVLSDVLASLPFPDATSRVSFVPTTLNPLTDSGDQQRLEGLIQALEDHEDTQNVVSNADY